MKLPIICDTHFGARNDSPIYLDHFMQFFDKVFFPWVELHRPASILHLGDFMDRRKFVNYATLNAVRERFIKPLQASGAEMHCILGNHDIFYKNTSQVNSLQELFSGQFIVHNEPCVQVFDGRPIALLPWINQENEAQSLKFIKTAKSDILCGHLELNGYNVLKNLPFEGGMNSDLFNKFYAVYSGHFHCRHSKGNIHYLGCPYQITMNDFGETRGFHVLDTDTGDLEFVANPYTIYSQIEYDDTESESTNPILAPEKLIRGKFVRVIVHAKTKPYLFERFIESLYSMNPHNVIIVEDLTPDIQEDEAVDLKEDTFTIINREIEGLQNVDIGRLKTFLRELYTETQNSQEN